MHALRPVLLRFRIVDKAGHPAVDLEPYMGMAGHLVTLRRDLSVFARVHPAGAVPMAALMLLDKSSDRNMDSMSGMHPQAAPAEITFPYGFPQAGDYRLFLQLQNAPGKWKRRCSTRTWWASKAGFLTLLKYYPTKISRCKPVPSPNSSP